MRHYDIILFENFHLAANHKFDMYQIAKMLKARGRSVAILDIYDEETDDSVEGVEVIKLPFHKPIPNDRWQTLPRTNKIISAFCYLRFYWQQHRYYKSVAKAVKDWCDCFYCGSYNVNMSTAFLRLGKPCVYWGLRSHWISGFRYFLFHRNPIVATHLLYVRRAFFKCPMAKLMVSNDIIMKEFEKIGVNKDRMFIREERAIPAKAGIPDSRETSRTVFLTIGMLRKEKQITKTIDAFKRANISDGRLMLVGRSVKGYENIITKAISGDPRIWRKNEFVEYDELNSFIKNASFVVFADKKGESCVTNGTMYESLINYRPIIAPDYEPYSYYVRKYHIGLLYDPDDSESFVKVLNQASLTDPSVFYQSIHMYLDTLLENVVAESVDKGIFGK